MAFNEKDITFKVDDDDYDNPAYVFFSQRSLFTNATISLYRPKLQS